MLKHIQQRENLLFKRLSIIFYQNFGYENYFKKNFFLNSNWPEKWYRLFKKKCQNDEFPEDSTELFQSNMLDRYLDRGDKSFKNGQRAERLAICAFQNFYRCLPQNQGQQKI